MVGQYNKAGLPNLKGSIKPEGASNVELFGADSFIQEGVLAVEFGVTYTLESTPTIQNNAQKLLFDASQYNTINGTSDTVMPASVNLQTGIYLGLAAKV